MFGGVGRKSESVPENAVAKQRREIGAADLAQILAEEVVNKFVFEPPKTDLWMLRHRIAGSNAKTRLYQLAVVLMALEKYERNDPGYAAVARHLENVFLPSSADEKTSFLAMFAAAKQDLAVLVMFFSAEEQRRRSRPQYRQSPDYHPANSRGPAPGCWKSALTNGIQQPAFFSRPNGSIASFW